MNIQVSVAVVELGGGGGYYNTPFECYCLFTYVYVVLNRFFVPIVKRYHVAHCST